MPGSDAPSVRPPTPEQRQMAAKQFERANQVISSGNFDYAIQLLLSCCKLEPANLVYRQALRATEKKKFKNNLAGSKLAFFTNSAARAKIKAAKRGRDWLKVLECGEEILARNPWDTGAQMDMAAAADAVGLLDAAVWILEQARQKNPKDAAVNRALARLLEKRGNFQQAMVLWDLIRKANPKDEEAAEKAKDLAVAHTLSARQQGKKSITASDAPPPSAPEAKDQKAAQIARDAAPAGDSGLSKPIADRVAQEAAPLLAKIKAEPTSANAYLHLATVYKKAGVFDQARAVIEQGLGPTGNQFELVVELADLEIEPFRRNLALTEHKLRASPNDEELLKIRVKLRKEINTRELELFRKKAERYPAEKGHRFEIGLRLLRAHQIDEAIRELQAARSDPRYQWRALLYLGHCFKQRHNWRLAQRNFEEALQSIPATEQETRKDVLFQLAQGHAEAGNLAKAIDLGNELANVDFAFRDIGRLIDEWQSRLDSGQQKVSSEQ